MTKPTITERVNQENAEFNQAYTEFCQDLGRNPLLVWEDVYQITHEGDFEEVESFDLSMND